MKPRSINTALLICGAGYRTAAGIETEYPFRLFRQSQSQKEARIRKRHEMAAMQKREVDDGISENNNGASWDSSLTYSNDRWGKAQHFYDGDCDEYNSKSKSKSKASKGKGGKSKSSKSKSSKSKASKCYDNISGAPTLSPVPTEAPLPTVMPVPTKRPTPRPVEPTRKVSIITLILVPLF